MGECLGSGWSRASLAEPTARVAMVRAVSRVREGLRRRGADLADAHITVSNRSVCPPLPSPGPGRAPATDARSRGPAAVANGPEDQDDFV